MADNTSNAGPKSTFEAYRAEGDILYKQQEFAKALESYNQALELKSDDKNCLVARSRCYLQMGDTENALKDAEASLQEEPSFFKGLLSKADTLYFKGDFEMALVYYHRGNKLRPEQQDFRLGIQKCREAIENSVGSPEKVKLRNDGDLSYFYKPLEEEEQMRKRQQQLRTGRRAAQAQKKQARPISGHRDKTIKQLLGSLYADREYLEKLLKEEDSRLDGLQRCGRCGYKLDLCSCSLSVRDRDASNKYTEEGFKVYSQKFKNKKIVLSPVEEKKKASSDSEDDEPPKRNAPKKIDAKEKKSQTSRAIHQLALNGLLYLDTRTDFWRQQKPMYARKRDRYLQLQQQAKTGKRANDPAKFTMQRLKAIDEETAKTMKVVEGWSAEELPNKQEVMASLHSSAGNAHLELGDYENALAEHQQDLDISQELDHEDLVSRALDNLGRVYARVGQFEEAIEIWEKKIQRKPEMQDLEGAWIYHELGRCYLEMSQTDKALEYGEKSYSYAQAAEDEVWQLHSSVLIAQSQAKKGEYDSAVDSFERALDFAKLQEDDDAQNAIKKALKEANDKLAEDAAEKPAEQREPSAKAREDEGDREESKPEPQRRESPKPFEEYTDGDDTAPEEVEEEKSDRASAEENQQHSSDTPAQRDEKDEEPPAEAKS